MRKALILSVCAGVLLVANVFAEVPILPLSQVTKGMQGYGLTVLEGTEPERFDIEVMGVLRKIGPDQDLILVKVLTPKLRESGVIAGMSGSPIYVDGKIIGALAYSWQFAKEPLAGITPIEQMLRIGDRGTAVPGGGVPAGASKSNAETFVRMLVEQDADAQWQSIMSPLRGASPVSSSMTGALPIATPIAFAGYDPSTIERFGSMIEGDRLIPVAAGSTGGAELQSSFDGFRAGDTFSALLVDGDFSVAANGTVTYVNGAEVYGFGHPFLDMGSVDLPMAQAEVVGVLPSLARSMKFANTGRIVGALRQDRLPGVLGVSNSEASMVPVTVDVGAPNGHVTHTFRIARSPELFPALLALTTDSIVAGTEKASGERTVVMDVGMTIKGIGKVAFRDGWAGLQARQSIPAYLGIVSQYLLSNEFQSADVESVHISLTHADDLRVVRIVDAELEDPSDGTVSPGDNLRLRATLKPYRGEPFVETFTVKIPEGQSPGRAFMFVGGGSFLNRLDFTLVPAVPNSMEQVLEVIERLRPSTELSYSLYTLGEGYVSSGAYHPALPPSMRAVIEGDTSNSQKAPVRYHPSVKGSKQLDQVVDGVVKIDVDIKPRV